MGEFQILEVNPWTWTNILVDFGTFFPSSMYVLIKPHIKWVTIPSSDTDSDILIVYIEQNIIIDYILVQQKASTLIFCKIIFKGFKM